MDKKTKLQRLLEVFQPDATAVDFTEFDNSVTQLKKGLKQKIQVKTVEDVNRQLEKFRQKLELGAVFDSVTNLEIAINQQIDGISSLMDEQVSSLKEAVNKNDENSIAQVSEISRNIQVLQDTLNKLNDQKSGEITVLKKNVFELQEFSFKAEKTLEEINANIKALGELEISVGAMQNDTSTKDQVSSLVNSIDALRIEFNNRINNLSVKGGNANRQININSSVMSTKYTDINFQAFGGIAWSAVDDDTNKRVDIRASITAATGGGPGGGITRSVSVISVSSTLAAAASTDYAIFANVGITVTLPTAISNTNLYTVKNEAASSVLVATTAGETIDGSATALLPTQYESLNFISNGSVWGVT